MGLSLHNFSNGEQTSTWLMEVNWSHELQSTYTWPRIYLEHFWQVACSNKPLLDGSFSSLLCHFIEKHLDTLFFFVSCTPSRSHRILLMYTLSHYLCEDTIFFPISLSTLSLNGLNCASVSKFSFMKNTDTYVEQLSMNVIM